LMGRRLLQISITLFDSSLLVRFIRDVPCGFRKAYTPGWNGDCENLYQEYNTNHDRATANRLLEELNDQRKRKWKKTLESTNFSHSSRKAWSLLWKLATESNTGASSSTHHITAKDIRDHDYNEFPKLRWLKVWNFDPHPSTALFQFLMPGMRHGQHCNLSTVI
jgi:hypothetical protein